MGTLASGLEPHKCNGQSVLGRQSHQQNDAHAAAHRGAPTATPTGADADGAAAAVVAAPDTDFVAKFERTSSVKEARCMVGERQNVKRPNPFRSGIAIDSTTWSFIISSYHLLRGRLLATFSSPPLGFAVTSFGRATRPFYLLVRIGGGVGGGGGGD